MPEPKDKAKNSKPIPAAYFITYHTYGTWLHGDARESMDRRYFNKFNKNKIPPRPNLEGAEIEQRKYPEVRLSHKMRVTVRDAIREVCKFRSYTVYAMTVRTNHVHVVVSGKSTPEKIMNEFKAYSTRRLREGDLVKPGTKIWVRHGSTRYLWKPQEIAGAVDYVLYGQGDNVPSFDTTVGL